MSIDQMSGVTPELAATLQESGITNVEEMAASSVDQIVLLAGLDEDVASDLIATARATLEEMRKQVEEIIAREKAEAEAELSEKDLFGEDAGEEEKLEESEIFGESDDEEKTEEPSSEKKLTEEDLFGEKAD